MPFLTEIEPPRHTLLPVAPGIARIVANNPGVMTYHGTNTYLIDTDDGLTVLDPGPADEAHIEDIVRTAARPITSILISHFHQDHLGAAAGLKARTGAKTFAFHLGADPSFSPDVLLKDGDIAAGMQAIHTPGHASDHLCFARPDGIIFSADHVMSWSSSVVSPPDGDMAAYFNSLKLMLARSDRLLLPGHGPAMTDPAPYIQELLDNRVKRENAIAAALEGGGMKPRELVDRLYSKTEPRLLRAAERNVNAHLLKLRQDGRVRQQGESWVSV